MKKQGVLNRVRLELLSGSKYTLMQLNKIADTTDSAKCISRLRSKGMQIADHFGIDGKKVYWYDPQITINFE